MFCFAGTAVVVGIVGWLFAQWNHPRPPWTEQERMRW